MAEKKIKVKLVKSINGCLTGHVATVRGLGLRRLNHVVELLARVKEISGDAISKTGIMVGLGEQARFDHLRYGRVCAEAAKAIKNGPVRRALSYLAELDVPGKSPAWKARRRHVVGRAC